MLYSNTFCIADRRAVIALLTIRCYVARLNACCIMGSIILYNERKFYR